MSELDEDPANRARRYIRILEKNLESHRIKEQRQYVKAENVMKILDTIRSYVNDSRYYLDNNKPTTALASVAYAEGLLDSLILLETTEPTT